DRAADDPQPQLAGAVTEEGLDRTLAGDLRHLDLVRFLAAHDREVLRQRRQHSALCTRALQQPARRGEIRRHVRAGGHLDDSCYRRRHYFPVLEPCCSETLIAAASTRSTVGFSQGPVIR